MHSAAEARGADKATRIGAVTDLPLNEIADAMQISSGLHYVSTEYGSVPSISYDDAAMNELAALAYTVFRKRAGLFERIRLGYICCDELSRRRCAVLCRYLPRCGDARQCGV